MNNATVSTTYAGSNGGGGSIKYGIYSDSAITLNLIGDSKVAPADAGYAVSTEGLTVKGTGSLTAQGDYGLQTGDLTINSGSVTFIADGEWGDGIQEYSKALSYQPNEYYIWYALATCFEEIGDLQNAHQAVQVSLDIMPSNGHDHTHDWTGVSLHAEGMLERVRRELLEGEG